MALWPVVGLYGHVARPSMGGEVGHTATQHGVFWSPGRGTEG